MQISYSNCYPVIRYKRNLSGWTYVQPDKTLINNASNAILFDEDTENIYAYLYHPKEGNKDGSIELLHGCTWTGKAPNNTDFCDNAYNKFAYFSIDPFQRTSNSFSKPYGAYSVALGYNITCYNSFEVGIGTNNRSGRIYVPSEAAYTSYILFSVGNGEYRDETTNTYSNSLTVASKHILTSVDTYIGYSASVASSTQTIKGWDICINSNKKSNLYVNGASYTNTLYIGTDNDTYPLIGAENYSAEKIHSEGYSDGEFVNWDISKNAWNQRVAKLKSKYTIDWIDYYEMMFRDTVVLFKKIENNADSVNEYSTFNTNEFNNLIAVQIESGGGLTGRAGAFCIKKCYPVFVKNLWTDGRPGRFQIYVHLKVVGTEPGDGYEPKFYMRPCKEAYYVLAAVGADVDFWFRESDLGSEVHGRWSPMTQYQDMDQSDKRNLSRTFRSITQIYYCVDEHKYYRMDPVTTNLVEINWDVKLS